MTQGPPAAGAPRILFLSTGMEVGGAEQQLLSTAAALADRGWSVRIVSLIALGPLGLEARRLGIPTDSLDMARGTPDPRGALRLVRLARSWKPAILHTHMVHANLMGRVLRPVLGVPVVISTIHSIQDGGRLRLLGYRLTDRFTDLTTIVSEAAAERYIEVGAVPRTRLRVIPNAVDAERFRPDPETRRRLRRELGIEDAFMWLAVGRFEPAKDYPTMLAAFARLRKARPESRLVLVGEGSLRGEAEALARSLDLGNRLRFLGIRRDVPGLMGAADAYVLSSAWEGMPTVLLEAAAASLPVVATAVGGNREVVHDRSTGFVVPARSPDALGSAMLRLMEASPEERAAMGDRGREVVLGRYTLPRIVDRWEETYRELLDRKRPARTGQRAGQGVGALSGGQR